MYWVHEIVARDDRRHCVYCERVSVVAARVWELAVVLLLAVVGECRLSVVSPVLVRALLALERLLMPP